MASREQPHRPAQAAGLGPPEPSEERSDEDEQAPPAPWHFKVLVVGTIGYLIYRAIWFGFWLTHHV